MPYQPPPPNYGPPDGNYGYRQAHPASLSQPQAQSQLPSQMNPQRHQAADYPHHMQQPMGHQYQHPTQQYPLQQQQRYYSEYPAQYPPDFQGSYLPPQQSTFSQGVQQPVLQNQYQPASVLPQQTQQQQHSPQLQAYYQEPPRLQHRTSSQSFQPQVQVRPVQQYGQPAPNQPPPMHQQQNHQQKRQSHPNPQVRIPSQRSPRPPPQDAWSPQASRTPSVVTQPHIPQQQQQQPKYQTYQANSSPVSQATPNRQHSQPRSVARVIIPVQRPPTQSPASSETPHVLKRRRSNDGTAVPVNARPTPQKTNVQQGAHAGPVASSPATKMSSSQAPPTPTPSIDYSGVLLSLADEYTSAAYSMSGTIASAGATEKQTQEYQSLMATAMGCLETVLNNCRQPDARMEARVRLRLARLMLEETENSAEIEDILGRGVALCERNRLPDMKYAMQHLLAQVMLKSNSKATMKAVDKLIDEVEALKLLHWVYTFRFLRTSLVLQSRGHADTATALKNLAAIARTAEGHRDVTVQLVAAVLEVIVHLRSDSPDTMESAQRALAAARTHQLGPELQRLPQIRTLLDCLDVALYCAHFDAGQLRARVQQMHSSMDAFAKDPAWKQDGTFLVPLGHKTHNDIDHDTAGILKQADTGEIALSFCWLTRDQHYTLAYLLSSFATIHKNNTDGMAEKFLTEGLKLSVHVPDPLTRSLASARSSSQWSNELHATFLLQHAFVYCSRCDWSEAQTILMAVRKDLCTSTGEQDGYTLNTMLCYLEGMCKQGLGDLESAYASYNMPSLTFDPTTKGISALKDLRALATLNKIAILRVLFKPGDMDEESLLSLLEPYLVGHHNKPLLAAFYFVKSLSDSAVQGQIMKAKQFLQQAVNHAKVAQSNPMLCIIMNIMTHKYFANIVGEQAEKSGKVGRTLAKTTKNRLWIAVADDMLANTMDLCGKHEDAWTARLEGEEAYESLPQSLKDSLQMMRGE